MYYNKLLFNITRITVVMPEPVRNYIIISPNRSIFFFTNFIFVWMRWTFCLNIRIRRRPRKLLSWRLHATRSLYTILYRTLFCEMIIIIINLIFFFFTVHTHCHHTVIIVHFNIWASTLFNIIAVTICLLRSGCHIYLIIKRDNVKCVYTTIRLFLI